jgi:putative MATE family efflux protein
LSRRGRVGDVIRAPAPSTRRALFLNGPVASTLFRLSWPNILVMSAQASTGLIETWWLSRLGTDALAGMALVFPVVMLMQMMSGGAIGGGISSAVARALGAGRQADADALVLHALMLNVAFGALFSALVLSLGPSLYRLLGGDGGSLQAALRYSNVVFSGLVLLWVMNGLTAVIRGTGNMLVPALVICGGVVLLVPLSPLLIFGIGPFPRMGVAGGGAALVLYYLFSTIFFAWYLLSGRNPARFRWVRLRWSIFYEILRVGGLAAISSLQTNLTIAITTSLVGRWFGEEQVAGYGTGARLEYLLMPIVFGIGSTLVAMVGMNVGAGQCRRALRIALVGAGAAFLMTETLGLAAAIWPEAWLRLFDTDPAMLASGSAYLRIVGPFYGCYGFGFGLYFAAQGAGKLLWPLFAGFLRLVIAAVGGWAALAITGSESWLFAALAAGLLAYGAVIGMTTLSTYAISPPRNVE